MVWCMRGDNKTMKLHAHQQALLKFIKKQRGDLRPFSLRDIGKEIGLEDRAQIVVHHLEQLENKGFIRRLNPNERLYQVLDNPASQVVYVDLYKSTAQCGPEGFLGDDLVIDRVPLASKTFGITNPSDFFLIKTRGKSMEPVIKEGDLVLARKQSDVENGQIAVVVHDGKPKIKKVTKVKMHKQQVIILKSLNTEFNDEEIAGEDSDFRICGQVKGVIRVQ